MIRSLSIVAVLSGIIAWVLAVALIDRQGGGIENIVVKKPPQSKISYGNIRPLANENAPDKTSETLSAFVHIPKASTQTTQTSTETPPLYGWKIGSLSDPIPYCKETARPLTGYGEQISWLDVKCDNDGSRARFARRVFVQPDTTKNRVRILAANVEVQKMRHILTTMVNEDRNQIMSYMWGSGEFEGEDESESVQVKINLLSLNMTDIDVRVSSKGYKVSFFFLLYATAEEISCFSCFEKFRFRMEGGASLDLEIIERKSGFSLDSETIDWNNSFDVVVKHSSGFHDFRFAFPDKLKLGVFARAIGTSDYEFKTKMENAIKKKMKKEIANKLEDISEEINSKINKILTDANRVEVMRTLMKKFEKITTEGDIRVDLRSPGRGSSLLISLSVDAKWFGRQVPDIIFQPHQRNSQINIKISYATINKILESLLDDREIGTVINDVNQIFGGGRSGSLDDLLDDEFSSIMDELASTTGVEMGRLDAMKLPLRLRPVDKDTVRVFAAGITGLLKPVNHRDISIYVFAEAQAGIDRGMTEEDIQHLRNHFSLEPWAIRENSEAMNRFRALSAVFTEVLEGSGDRWAELLVDSKAQNLRDTPNKIDNKLGKPLADLIGRLTSNNRNLWNLKLMSIENDINQHALMVQFNIR